MYIKYLLCLEDRGVTLKIISYKKKEKKNTVNVDIFACIHFREIMKMGNFASIKIRVLSITGSLWY